MQYLVWYRVTIQTFEEMCCHIRHSNAFLVSHIYFVRDHLKKNNAGDDMDRKGTFKNKHTINFK